MRIVCQKCSAAYAIDDKFVTPKGVRAQCPRCRHLQLVKRDEPEAPVAVPPPPVPPSAAPPPPKGSEFLFDLDNLPPPTQPAAFPAMSLPSAPPAPPPPPPLRAPNTSEELDFSEFSLGGSDSNAPTSQAAPDFRLDAPSAPPPAAPPPSSSGGDGDFLDFSELNSAANPMPPDPDPFGDLAAAPPPPPPPKPASSAPRGSDFGPRGQMLTQSVSGVSGPFSAKQPPPAGAPEIETLVRCKSCNKVLTDPFDQALGICDDCRDKQNSQPVSLADAPPLTTPVGALKAKPPDELETVPKPVTVPRPVRSVQSAARSSDDEGGSGRGRTVAIAVVVLALLAGGGYALVKRPWVRKAPPLAQRLPVGSARPIEAMVERWKVQTPGEVSGSASEYLRAGEEKLSNDTTQGYREAEEAFKKALMLDKSSDQAVAGWALAVAFGRGKQLDDETARMAEQMLTAAGQRGGDNRVFIAQAHLMLVRDGNFNDVKALAERGLKSQSEKDQALAELALGELYRTKSPEYAGKHFADALKHDPKLKRGYLYQARLQITQGQLREAVTSLDKRLELDPDQWEAADTLAQLLIEVGEVERAHQVYQKAADAVPDSLRPKLMLAVLAYQHENNASGAVERFDTLLKDRETLDKRDLSEMLAHLSAAERLGGDLTAAATSAQAAVDAAGDNANAHLQRFIIALEQNDAATARTHLAALKLGNAGLEQALEGRLLFAEGKFPEALAQLQKAIATDPRRTDALLLGAAAAAKAKNESKAWELALKKGLAADPHQSGPQPVMSRYFVRPADLLRPARNAFSALPHDAEDPNVPMAEGLVAWHSGDLAAADAAFGKVVSFDPANANGYAWRALAALKKKDLPTALRSGGKAVESDRKLGLAHYALGAIQLQMKQVEPARKSLRTAIENAPGLLAAKTRLAEADLKVKKLTEAQAALQQVLLADPAYLDAKRVLYQLGAP